MKVSQRISGAILSIAVNRRTPELSGGAVGHVGTNYVPALRSLDTALLQQATQLRGWLARLDRALNLRIHDGETVQHSATLGNGSDKELSRILAEGDEPGVNFSRYVV